MSRAISNLGDAQIAISDIYDQLDVLRTKAQNFNGRLLTGIKNAVNPKDAVNLESLVAYVDSKIGPVVKTIPSKTTPAARPQILVTNQAGIATLALLPSRPNLFIYVTDYYHWLIWDGVALSFADGGSNYFCFSDSAPGNGWVTVHGQSVNYLKSDGTIGTKTLNDTTTAAFLKLGLGSTGGFTSAVAPTISGSCSVTGSCTVSSISVTGSCTVSSVSVTGTCAGALTTGYGTGDWEPALNIGLSGTASVSGTVSGSTGGATYTVNPGITGTTGGANANMDSVTTHINGFEITAADVTITGTVGVTVSVGATDFEACAYDESCTSIGEVAITSTLHASVDSTSWTQTASGSHTHSAPNQAFAPSWSDQIVHIHDYSSAVLSAGSHTHSGSTLSLASGSVDVTSLYIDQTALNHHHTISAIPLTGTCTATGTGSGTCSASGTGSGTISGSGSISATAATNGTPRSWNMQAWFRI